ETQEYLAEREQDRDREVRRGQNEAAEQRKALDEERLKMEAARQQYNDGIKAALEVVQHSIAGEFADIKNIDDVEKLAREDWARYIAWDAAQKKQAALAAEVKAAQDRQAGEQTARYSQFAKWADARFIERNPEFADKDKMSDLQKGAISTLKDIGWTEE